MGLVDGRLMNDGMISPSGTNNLMKLEFVGEKISCRNVLWLDASDVCNGSCKIVKVGRQNNIRSSVNSRTCTRHLALAVQVKMKIRRPKRTVATMMYPTALARSR